MISFGGRADQFRDALARQFDGFFSGPSKRMIAAGGVAELLHEVGQHLFENSRIHGSGRVVVHVDGQLDPVGIWVLTEVLTAGGRRLGAHDLPFSYTSPKGASDFQTLRHR